MQDVVIAETLRLDEKLDASLQKWLRKGVPGLETNASQSSVSRAKAV